MDISEYRIIGALLLLLGFSFLAASVYTGQIDSIVKMLSNAFKTVVA